jgi:hypothetical protein
MSDLGDAADHVQALGEILVTTLTEDEDQVLSQWVEEMKEKRERDHE